MPAKLTKFAARKKFCAFLYFRTNHNRNRIYRQLNAIRPVDALGAACRAATPFGFESTRHVNTAAETYNDIAVRTYQEYQYVLAIENAWLPGYFTEKLINPILAGSVPIYWGHPGVFEYVNKARVIYIPDFADIAELAKHLASLTAAKWDAIVAEPTYTKKGIVADIEQRLLDDVAALFA